MKLFDSGFKLVTAMRDGVFQVRISTLPVIAPPGGVSLPFATSKTRYNKTLGYSDVAVSPYA